MAQTVFAAELVHSESDNDAVKAFIKEFSTQRQSLLESKDYDGQLATSLEAIKNAKTRLHESIHLGILSDHQKQEVEDLMTPESAPQKWIEAVRTYYKFKAALQEEIKQANEKLGDFKEKVGDIDQDFKASERVESQAYKAALERFKGLLGQEIENPETVTNEMLVKLQDALKNLEEQQKNVNETKVKLSNALKAAIDAATTLPKFKESDDDDSDAYKTYKAAYGAATKAKENLDKLKDTELLLSIDEELKAYDEALKACADAAKVLPASKKDIEAANCRIEDLTNALNLMKTSHGDMSPWTSLKAVGDVASALAAVKIPEKIEDSATEDVFTAKSNEIDTAKAALETCKQAIDAATKAIADEKTKIDEAYSQLKTSVNTVPTRQDAPEILRCEQCDDQLQQALEAAKVSVETYEKRLNDLGVALHKANYHLTQQSKDLYTMETLDVISGVRRALDELAKNVDDAYKNCTDKVVAYNAKVKQWETVQPLLKNRREAIAAYDALLDDKYFDAMMQLLKMDEKTPVYAAALFLQSLPEFPTTFEDVLDKLDPPSALRIGLKDCLVGVYNAILDVYKKWWQAVADAHTKVQSIDVKLSENDWTVTAPNFSKIEQAKAEIKTGKERADQQTELLTTLEERLSSNAASMGPETIVTQMEEMFKRYDINGRTKRDLLVAGTIRNNAEKVVTGLKTLLKAEAGTGWQKPTNVKQAERDIETKLVVYNTSVKTTKKNQSTESFIKEFNELYQKFQDARIEKNDPDYSKISKIRVFGEMMNRLIGDSKTPLNELFDTLKDPKNKMDTAIGDDLLQKCVIYAGELQSEYDDSIAKFTAAFQNFEDAVSHTVPLVQDAEANLQRAKRYTGMLHLLQLMHNPDNVMDLSMVNALKNLASADDSNVENLLGAFQQLETLFKTWIEVDQNSRLKYAKAVLNYLVSLATTPVFSKLIKPEEVKHMGTIDQTVQFVCRIVKRYHATMKALMGTVSYEADVLGAFELLYIPGSSPRTVEGSWTAFVRAKKDSMSSALELLSEQLKDAIKSREPSLAEAKKVLTKLSKLPSALLDSLNVNIMLERLMTSMTIDEKVHWANQILSRFNHYLGIARNVASGLSKVKILPLSAALFAKSEAVYYPFDSLRRVDDNLTMSPKEVGTAIVSSFAVAFENRSRPKSFLPWLRWAFGTTGLLSECLEKYKEDVPKGVLLNDAWIIQFLFENWSAMPRILDGAIAALKRAAKGGADNANLYKAILNTDYDDAELFLKMGHLRILYQLHINLGDVTTA